MPETNYTLLFSRNLNKYLALRGMNQQDLLFALKHKGIVVAPSSVSYWCNGKKAPRMDKVDAICSILGIKRSDLIEDKKSDSTIEMDLHLSTIEKNIITSYRKSDEIDQQMVRRILHVDEIDTAELKAAHVRTDIRPTAAGKAHDDAIMDNDNEWK